MQVSALPKMAAHLLFSITRRFGTLSSQPACDRGACGAQGADVMHVAWAVPALWRLRGEGQKEKWHHAGRCRCFRLDPARSVQPDLSSQPGPAAVLARSVQPSPRRARQPAASEAARSTPAERPCRTPRPALPARLSPGRCPWRGGSARRPRTPASARHLC